jgi:cobalamin synthase
MTFENPIALTSAKDDKITSQNKIEKNFPLIDARGPRFGALITVVMLSLTLVLDSALPLLVQGVVFMIGATFGPQRTPYALIFKKLIKPRLRGDVPTEDVRPPQFAQAVGLVFAIFALLGFASSSEPLFLIATSMALAAAFLNAAFNYCLGCEMYLLLTRAFKR